MVNLKLTVIDEADYSYIKEFCDFAESKGYTVSFIDNGNIVFEKDKSPTQTTTKTSEVKG